LHFCCSKSHTISSLLCKNKTTQTFKAWINAQLRVRNIKIEGELKDDLKDGLALINLMEVLSGEKCPEKYNTKITLDMHRIENTTIAINFITKHVGKLSVSSTGTHPHPCLAPPSCEMGERVEEDN
jgi:hypothetical protein